MTNDQKNASASKSCCASRKGAAIRSTPVHISGKSTEQLPDRMITIPGGPAYVGTDGPALPIDGEGPQRRVGLKPFAIDPYAVTNNWFDAFIKATDYETDAEAYGWSLVFETFAPDEANPLRVAQTPWWRKIEGADWAHPFGPQSNIDGLEDHPVTHVSWNDATAFAKWAGGRLPTEAEWEHAAQGGDRTATYPWGQTEPDPENILCNIWQGEFPHKSTKPTAEMGTNPVGSFAPNPYGLHNMVGNVWEWCADTFRIRSLSARARAINTAAKKENDRLLKGGSYLCHKSYCYRYRIAARTGVRADSSSGHMGFRLVGDA